MKPAKFLPFQLFSGALGCTMLSAPLAMGQQVGVIPTTAPATTEPAAAVPAGMGPQYISRSSGIQFNAPVGSKQVDQTLPDLVAEFANEPKNWRLQVSRITFETPEPLTIHFNQFGKPLDGQIEKRIADVQRNLHATLIRNEIIAVGRANVGMISYRYDTANRTRMFEQVAIIDAPDTDDRVFYIMDMTGPGQSADSPAGQIDPGEKDQFEAFGKAVDSVKLFPLGDLRIQQDRELFNTRELFTLWDSNNFQRIRAVMVPVQYQRILRNGKDAGWVYIGEEIHLSGKEKDWFDIGVHSWMRTADDQIWESQAVYHSSLDRAHEHWESLVTGIDHDAKPLLTITMQGTGDSEMIVAPGNPAPVAVVAGQPAAPQNNGPTIQNIRTLHVKQTFQAPNNVIVQTAFDKPAFANEYIPQLYSYILPTLMPLDHPDQYMFAEFKPTGTNAVPGGAAGDVMRRYLDVSARHQYIFNGSEYDGYEITAKIGVDGKPTTYYMDAAGKMVGSSMFDGKVQVIMLPSTAEQLQRLWQKPNLKPPNPVPADPTAGEPK